MIDPPPTLLFFLAKKWQFFSFSFFSFLLTNSIILSTQRPPRIYPARLFESLVADFLIFFSAYRRPALLVRGVTQFGKPTRTRTGPYLRELTTYSPISFINFSVKTAQQLFFPSFNLCSLAFFTREDRLIFFFFFRVFHHVSIH